MALLGFFSKHLMPRPGFEPTSESYLRDLSERGASLQLKLSSGFKKMRARSTSTLLWKLGDKLKPETRLDFEFSTKNGKNRFFRGGFDIYYFQSDIETFPIFFFRQKGWIFFFFRNFFGRNIFLCPKMAQKPFVRKSNNSFFFCLTSIFFTRAREKNRHSFFFVFFFFHFFG